MPIFLKRNHLGHAEIVRGSEIGSRFQGDDLGSDAGHIGGYSGGEVYTSPGDIARDVSARSQQAAGQALSQALVNKFVGKGGKPQPPSKLELTQQQKMAQEAAAIQAKINAQIAAEAKEHAALMAKK